MARGLILPRVTARGALSFLLLLAASLASPAFAAPGCRHVPEVILGLDAQGRPTPRWIDAVRDRVDMDALKSLSMTARPLSADEAAWVALVRDEARTWCPRVVRLNAPFRHVTPPRNPKILLGNQGGDDGFTSGTDAVAMDLSALVRVYGSAGLDENHRLVRRLLSHEYTHLLVHPWLDSVGWSADWAGQDPYLQALRVLFNEGLGNLRSIEDSDQWVSADGQLTDFAKQKLAVLEPRMLERLKGLEAHPAPEEAARLMRNISQGSLSDKWGAIPIALWLAEDTSFDPDRLAVWVGAKPDFILALAVRRADPRLRPAFRQLLDRVAAHVVAHRQPAHPPRRATTSK